ncbi:MAG: magnesium transporter, partial [Bacteroidales bacterium]
MVDIKTRFEQLIENKDWKELKVELNDIDPVQITEIIEDAPDGDDVLLFRLLNRKLAKETFQLLSHDMQEEIIESMARNVKKLSTLLNDIEPDDRTAFFEELPGTISQRLIQFLSPEERNTTIRLLGYPEDSIGRLMTPEYVAINPEHTIEEAFAHIRVYGKDSETLNVVYIVDKDWKLVDDIRIKELILADPQQKVQDLMDYRFTALNAMDDQETAIGAFQDY